MAVTVFMLPGLSKGSIKYQHGFVDFDHAPGSDPMSTSLKEYAERPHHKYGAVSPGKPCLLVRQQLQDSAFGWVEIDGETTGRRRGRPRPEVRHVVLCGTA
jgi:hypothetical protein